MGFTIWRRARLNALGIIVLLVGLGTSGLIYWHAPTNDGLTDKEVLLEQSQSKAYHLGLERNVGSVGVLMAQWDDAIEELGQPRPLAVTITIVSCLTAAGCFWMASRQSA